MSLVQRMDRRLYPGFDRKWDDWLFRERILQRLGPESVVLDLGAGAGIVAAMDFRGQAAQVCGIDPDPRVTENPFLDDGRVGVGEAIPYPDGHFDLVFADNVLEHLERPAEVFREVARVLKPGGRFLAKTPNAWHYMPLIARLTPHAFHQWVNRWRGRGEADIFPTRYRANTPKTLCRLAQEAGLALDGCDLIEGRPEYLRMTAPTYLLGFAYERLVNGVPGLAPLRILLVAELVRPDPDAAA